MSGTRRPYVPNVPGGTPPGLAAELRKLAAEASETARVTDALRADLTTTQGNLVAEEAARIAADALLVLKAGDTMTGDLTVSKNAPRVFLNKNATSAAGVTGRTSGNTRWTLLLGTNDTESGSNAGSNFRLDRHNDAGTLIDSPLAIDRATGQITLTGPMSLVGNVAVTGRVTQTNAPAAYVAICQAGMDNPANLGVLTGGTLRTNVGSVYNSTNGRFTAPVAGRYLVSFTGLTQDPDTNPTDVRIDVNGVAYAGGRAYVGNISSAFRTLSCTTVLTLNANDYVEFVKITGTLHPGEFPHRVFALLN